jgi:hypothetical protein
VAGETVIGQDRSDLAVKGDPIADFDRKGRELNETANGSDQAGEATSRAFIEWVQCHGKVRAEGREGDGIRWDGLRDHERVRPGSRRAGSIIVTDKSHLGRFNRRRKCKLHRRRRSNG